MGDDSVDVDGHIEDLDEGLLVLLALVRALVVSLDRRGLVSRDEVARLAATELNECRTPADGDRPLTIELSDESGSSADEQWPR